MNNGWDSFSMPKQVGKDLIAMHLKRGDSIYFITGRSPTKTETVTESAARRFLNSGCQYEFGDLCRRFAWAKYQGELD